MELDPAVAEQVAGCSSVPRLSESCPLRRHDSESRAAVLKPNIPRDLLGSPSPPSRSLYHRVLIVEADADVRREMSDLLPSAEFDVYAFGLHAKACDQIARGIFDLIITDLPGQEELAEEDLCDDPTEVVPEIPAATHALATPNATPPPASPIDAVMALQWVERLRAAAPMTPILVITRPGIEAVAAEALLRGVASYVPRRRLQTTFLETVRQVLNVRQATANPTVIEQCLDRLKITLRLPNQESLVPSVIATMEQTCAKLDLFDEMIWTQVAMALDEAVLNAIIHGNLEVSSELREQGDGSAFWDLIHHRQESDPYQSRRVEVTLTATRNQAVFTIKDSGPGFDLASIPDPTDPSHLEDIGGRGLLLISAFMDEVRYNDTGNEVTMVKRKAEGPREE